ncbi:hypothetical protein GQ54DRAFT_125747 [Martensiomyces pterosporus]|nr:hypothetical protein GQ54DRAFT_125747 [Martensiomyces pterosporus]
MGWMNGGGWGRCEKTMHEKRLLCRKTQHNFPFRLHARRQAGRHVHGYPRARILGRKSGRQAQAALGSGAGAHAHTEERQARRGGWGGKKRTAAAAAAAAAACAVGDTFIQQTASVGINGHTCGQMDRPGQWAVSWWWRVNYGRWRRRGSFDVPLPSRLGPKHIEWLASTYMNAEQ